MGTASTSPTPTTGSSACGTDTATVTSPELLPTICVSPQILCDPGTSACSTYPSATRAHMWVNATGNSSISPWVQVVFVTETSLYDGVYDPSASDYGGGVNGNDPCSGPCEESDGVPFITHNIAKIAQGITMKNAGVTSSSHVTFSMVDYFSTVGKDHDDSDGSEYNVDVSTFEPASTFATTITNMANGNTLFGNNWVSSTSVYEDSDFSDNFLSSSMITALYGALHGSGLTWVNNASTYHVIVWVGSTLPRDAAYKSDWCTTYNDYANACADPTSTTEPAYTYASGLASPAGQTLANITTLAQQEHVIIDTIDLPDGMTLLGSKDYANTGNASQGDVNHILSAGCYLAQQTGGSWEGPTPTNTGTGFTCSAAPAGSGSAGNLTNTFRTPSNGNWQWANNPSLGWALTNINFPSTHFNYSVIAWTGEGAFQYIPAPGFALDPAGMTYQCINNGTDISNACASSWHAPIGLGGYGWAWPLSAFYPDDSWSVSFTVNVSVGFPGGHLNTSTPIDACLNTTSWSGCGGPQGTLYTWEKYTNYTKRLVNQSFPPAYVDVVSNGNVASLTGVSISPSWANLSYGAAQTFKATPTCTGGTTCPTGLSYSWTLTNGTLGGLSSYIGQSVTFTAGATNGTLGLIVNATLYGLTAKSSPAMITVAPPVVLTGVDVNPKGPVPLTVGSLQNFTATPVCSGGSCASGGVFTWNLTNSLAKLNSSAGTTISMTAGGAAGNVTLFVNATLNGIKKQSAPVLVLISTIPPPALESVAITPNTAVSLNAGSTQTFTAVPYCASPGCASVPTYFWTLTNGTFGGLNLSTGNPVLFTAGGGSGNLTLSVSATLNGIAKQSLPVKITIHFVPPPPAITNVTLSPPSDTMNAGAAQSFSATPACSATCPAPIVYLWTLNNSLGSLNSTTGSLVLFKAGPTGGLVSIVVRATGGGASASSNPAIVTIRSSAPPPLESVVVTPSPATVSVLTNLTFSAVITCSTACPSGATYVWSLTVGTYGSLGGYLGNQVTFRAGAHSGATVLFVNVTLNQVTIRSTPVDITIQPSSSPVLSFVTIRPSQYSMSPGASFTFTADATCTGSGCPDTVGYSWQLSSTLGSISPSTGSTTVFMAGGAPGAVTLSVTATLNGKTATNSTVITIQSQGTQSTGFNLGSTGWIVIAIAAAIGIGLLAVVFGARRRRQHPPPDADPTYTR